MKISNKTFIFLTIIAVLLITLSWSINDFQPLDLSETGEAAIILLMTATFILGFATGATE